MAVNGLAVTGVAVGAGVGVDCGASCPNTLTAPANTKITRNDLRKRNTLELLPEKAEHAGFFKTKADCNIIDVYGHFARADVKEIDESRQRKDAQNLAKLMFNVVLVEPEIPPNTGNIARLCAATNTQLHIVGVTGFRMDDRTLKRAGLDYWDEVTLHRHIDLDALYSTYPDARFVYLTTKSERPYTDWQFADGDFLVFGPETRGLPAELLAANSKNCLKIPMANANVRSLNLATSVGIVLFEAIRQQTS